MVINIVSFDGFALNDASYQTYFVATPEAMGRAADPVTLPVIGGFPRDEGFEYKATSFQICVIIQAGTIATAIETLKAAFAPGRYGALAINDGAAKQRMCRVTQVFPYARGPATVLVSLEAADARWRATTDTVTAHTVTASGQTWAVVNAGNAAVDDAVITITPNTVKAIANGYRYRRRIVYANRVGRPLDDWVYDFTNGGINHAALVTAAKSLSTGNDMRLLQDGVELERYFGENAATVPNAATTKVWATPPYIPAMREAHLLASIVAGTTTLRVLAGETALWPPKGYFVIESTGEVCSYDGKTDADSQGSAAFTGVLRGRWGTTAGSASANAHLIWVPHQFDLIYGYSSATAPEARPDRKPLLDLASSTLTNVRHELTNFYDDTYPNRPGGLTRSLEQRDTEAGYLYLPTGSPAASIQFEYDWTSVPTAKDNYNVLRRRIPVGTDGTSGHVAFTRTLDATMTLVPLGTASDAIERMLGTAPLLGPLTSATYSAPAGNKLYEFALYGRSQIVKSLSEVPSAPLPTGALEFRQVAGINTSGGVTQAVTNEGDTPIIVTAVYAMLSEPTTPVRAATLTVFADNGSGAPNTAVTLWGPFNIASGSFSAAGVWQGGISNQFVILPGQTVHIQAFSSGTGSNLVWWGNGYELSYRIGGIGEIDEEAHGTHGAQINADALVFKLDTGAVPYFAMGAETDLYWLNGTLTNTTTGKSLTFGLFVSPGDQIEVDCGRRSVRNVTSGRTGLLYGVTPSDPDEFFPIAAGSNTWQWTETGVVSVGVSATFRAASE